jgi:hypothetical protein
VTPEELVNTLRYKQAELRLLSDAIGTEINAAFTQNMTLDDPQIRHLPLLRAYIDGAAALLVQAQTELRAHDQERAERLAEDFEELEGTSSSIPCPEIDIASGTQETQE